MTTTTDTIVAFIKLPEWTQIKQFLEIYE